MSVQVHELAECPVCGADVIVAEQTDPLQSKAEELGIELDLVTVLIEPAPCREGTLLLEHRHLRRPLAVHQAADELEAWRRRREEEPDGEHLLYQVHVCAIARTA